MKILTLKDKYKIALQLKQYDKAKEILKKIKENEIRTTN